jgi:hypothetical protein
MIIFWLLDILHYEMHEVEQDKLWF